MSDQAGIRATRVEFFKKINMRPWLFIRDRRVTIETLVIKEALFLASFLELKDSPPRYEIICHGLDECYSFCQDDK